MIRRPPRSTLFPTRRSSDLERRGQSTGMPDDEMIGSVPSDPTLRQTIEHRDRKSTRLNSSHQIISYAVFCLKKKKIHISNLDSRSNTRQVHSTTATRRMWRM